MTRTPPVGTLPADTRRASATTIESGGIEAIPPERRHGSPWQLFATWTAPNLEFATIFVGVIAVAFFGLGFWQAMTALVFGTAFGALTQGILSTWARGRVSPRWSSAARRSAAGGTSSRRR
ncbi:cytosine permease [Streptomyces sp. L7]|uniref:cytosine permease n=1 Tax=Streptomyces sp. L7 TaxID=3423954 RepID=UPI003D98AC93